MRQTYEKMESGELDPMSAKRWTHREEAYLAEKWGSISLQRIADTLGRTSTAVRARAYHLGLGPMTDAGDLITFAALVQAITGCRGNRKRCYDSWIIRHGLPAVHRRIGARSVLMIDLDTFWSWAEEHRGVVNFSKMPPLALGVEPDWLDDDRRICAHRGQRPWAANDDAALRQMIRTGRSWCEVCDALDRTQHSIIYRCGVLGIDTPQRDPWIPWTNEERELLESEILAYMPLRRISTDLQRSERAIQTFCRREYGTSDLISIRQSIKSIDNEGEK